MTLKHPDTEVEFDVPPADRPAHIAIIMDGNGRWALKRGLDRTEGHRAGITAARAVIEACGQLGIEALTLYSFSTENWKRPQHEVESLMALILEILPLEQDSMLEHGIQFHLVGDRTGLPAPVLAELERTEALTAGNSGPHLNIAMNYGGRQEIVNASRELARRVAAGELAPEDIDEQRFSDALWTAGLPDPDLLIRSGGDCRVSNFLLWQISYAEILIDERPWPDFDGEALRDAIREYAKRQRRYGDVAGN